MARRIAILAAAAMVTAMFAAPALAQEPVEVDDTIVDYTEVGDVVIERPEPEVRGVVIERGQPAAPAQVLGVQQRLAVTGGDIAVIVALAVLLLTLGTIAIRSGRRTTAPR